jgi:CO/xanthine dehydrogenase FAD-binding subunit
MPMKPPPFEYIRAESIEQVLEVLREAGDEAKLLAGGQSLLPMMNLRLARPTLLIDIGWLPLAQINSSSGGVTLGCLVRHRQLEIREDIRSHVPLLARCAREIGHPAIRNRGTIGGSLAHADPTAELALVAVTLDARIELCSLSGERTVEAQEFFRGAFTTELHDHEMLHSVKFPARSDGDHYGFCEFAERDGDFAMAAAACHLRVDGSDRVQSARVSVVGAEPRPIRLPEAEDELNGTALYDLSTRDVARGAVADLRVSDDAHISGSFRRHLLETLVGMALEQATLSDGVTA